MIYLHRGDDTDFENAQFLKFTIESEYEMSDWTARVGVLGIVKEVKDLSSGAFEVHFSNYETRHMSAGDAALAVQIIDGQNRIKTVGIIPIRITNEVVDNDEQVTALKLEKPTPLEIKVYVAGGGGGTSDHAKLTNLSYEKSGHTGFASSNALEEVKNSKQDKGDYVVSSELGNYVAIERFEQFDNQLDAKLKTINNNINDKADVEDIPQKVSELVNDKNYTTINEVKKLDYATSTDLKNGLSGKQDVGDYALRSDIPDVTNFIKDTDIASNTSAGIVKVGANAVSLDKNNVLVPSVYTYEQYQTRSNGNFISKGTLENVLNNDPRIGSGGTSDYVELTNKPSINSVELSGDKTLDELGIQASGDYALASDIPDVSNMVVKTDYATTTQAGLVKVGKFGFGLSAAQYLFANTYTYAQYSGLGKDYAISKGTLEDVINNDSRIGGGSSEVYKWTPTASYTVAEKTDFGSPTESKTINYDLSEYLPSDDYAYEILLRAKVYMSVTKNQYCCAYFSSSIIPSKTSIAVVSGRTPAIQSYTDDRVCTFMMPIGKDRRLTQYIGKGYNGAYDIYLFGYRKLYEDND